MKSPEVKTNFYKLARFTKFTTQSWKCVVLQKAVQRTSNHGQHNHFQLREDNLLTFTDGYPVQWRTSTQGVLGRCSSLPNHRKLVFRAKKEKIVGNFTYNNWALRQINIRLTTHTSHTKKEQKNVIPNAKTALKWEQTPSVHIVQVHDAQWIAPQGTQGDWHFLPLRWPESVRWYSTYKPPLCNGWLMSYGTKIVGRFSFFFTANWALNFLLFFPWLSYFRFSRIPATALESRCWGREGETSTRWEHWNFFCCSFTIWAGPFHLNSLSRSSHTVKGDESKKSRT